MEQKAKEAASHAAIPVSISAMLVTLGVVYGDIGTSPMYVTKALVAGNGGIGSVTEEFVLGALSLVVWTVTLLTTIKYVLISLRADNHGEGGIFALYSLVRRCGKWLIIPAMLGGAALLADGILTPAVTVTTAIEGLRTIPAVHAVLGDDQGRVVAITLAIIIVLFLVQRIGTAKIGHAFGPIMTLWFLFLGGTGLFFVLQPRRAAVPQPAPRHRLFVEPQQPRGHHDSGQLLPRHHRCRGALLRHGPRRPRQYLRYLAVR